MSSDDAALRAIGWPVDGSSIATDWARSISAHPDSRPARVIEQHRSGYVVAEGIDSRFAVDSLPDWQRPQLPAEQRPAVGDWLLIAGHADGNAHAVALLPRRSAVQRASVRTRSGRQIIAANIDTVFIVCGLDTPFNARRIERYLMLIGGQAQPVVVLTKTDLGAPGGGRNLEFAQAQMAEIDAGDTAVRAINAKDADSVTALHRWLGPGRTAVMVGLSGAGKSTLTNTLLGASRMRTGEVRASDARGRHTTTHRALIALPTGACLIDTPGMRQLRPTGEENVGEAGFADLEALAADCRFRNCRHINEPGCALRAAVHAGTLDAARLAGYLKLDHEIQRAAGRHTGKDTRPAGTFVPKHPRK